MKTTTIKLYVLIIVALATGSVLQAQTENVNERFSTQLKNGTVPGWQFSPVNRVPTPAVNNKQNEKENLITQIRKGTAAGMQFKPVVAGTAQPTVALRAAVAGKQPLASEQAVSVQPAKVEAVVTPKQE